MNTTPYFDEIGQTVPIENLSTLKLYAVLRLCFVGFAGIVCTLQLLRIGFWSGAIDRALIFAGVVVGIGLYTDSLDFVWRKLAPFGQLMVLVLLPLVIILSVVFSGSALISGIAYLTLIVVLALLAYSLLNMAKDPLRTARYRQIQRFLRTLPKSERSDAKQRAEREFKTLLAEGFD